jgi:hypothetical protein
MSYGGEPDHAAVDGDGRHAGGSRAGAGEGHRHGEESTGSTSSPSSGGSCPTGRRDSGIFYNVIDTASAIYWGAPEMAVLDNARHPDGKRELTSSGAVHSCTRWAHSHTRAPGEWNRVRLVVRGDHIEHWLNGTKGRRVKLGSADWKTRLAASKFADKPLYGTAREGRIGLQLHGSYVGYRNIKLRELK